MIQKLVFSPQTIEPPFEKIQPNLSPKKLPWMSSFTLTWKHLRRLIGSVTASKGVATTTIQYFVKTKNIRSHCELNFYNKFWVFNLGEINQIIMDELVLILILAGCSFQHFIAKEMRTIVFENNSHGTVKFIYSEKATKFCQISTVDLSYVVPVKSTVEISQNFCGLLKIYELYQIY